MVAYDTKTTRASKGLESWSAGRGNRHFHDLDVMNSTNKAAGGSQKNLVGMKVAAKVIVAKTTLYRRMARSLCVSVVLIPHASYTICLQAVKMACNDWR